MLRLNEEIRILRNQVAEYQLEVERLTILAQPCDFKSTLCDNMKGYIARLPKNSPLRRPTLKHLTTNLKRDSFCEFFAISQSTYYNCLREDETDHILITYPANVTREKFDEVHIELITQFLNLAMPTVSGRNYRLLIGTFLNFYASYSIFIQELEQGEYTVSDTYLRNYIRQFNIRRVKKVDICPTCANKEKKYNGQFIYYHKCLAKTQTTIAMKHKLQLARVEFRGILIVQDFTQIQLSPSSYLQDLIIVVYEKQHSENEPLKRTYYHWIGQTGKKNDINFVKGCWEEMLVCLKIENRMKLYIWSDGARKHYKQSGHMKFWSEIQERLREKNVTVEYNFYASYHGHNVCDAAASHIKRVLNNYQLHTADPIRNQSDILTCPKILEMKNIAIQPARIIPGIREKVSTMKGITKFHRFTFPTKGEVHAFEHSNTGQVSKIYEV